MTYIRYFAEHRTFGLLDYVLCTGLRRTEVLFHTFYCTFGQAEEYRSLYWGLRYIGPEGGEGGYSLM